MAQIGQGIAPSRPQARVAHMARRGLFLRFAAWTQGSWWVELVGWHWAAARACGVLSCGHVNVGSASGPGVLAAHADMLQAAIDLARRSVSQLEKSRLGQKTQAWACP